MFHHNVKQCYPFFKGPCWGIVIIFQEAISQLHGFDPFGFCQEDISLIKKLNELNHFFYWMQHCCLMFFFKSHQSPVLLELVQKPSGTIWFLMLWDPNWPRSCGSLFGFVIIVILRFVILVGMAWVTYSCCTAWKIVPSLSSGVGLPGPPLPHQTTKSNGGCFLISVPEPLWWKICEGSHLSPFWCLSQESHLRRACDH